MISCWAGLPSCLYRMLIVCIFAENTVNKAFINVERFAIVLSFMKRELCHNLDVNEKHYKVKIQLFGRLYYYFFMILNVILFGCVSAQ